jgi:alkyl sulfatase BDS1-like metallo-beta-lactamase superfamily hydrolase
VVRRGTLPPPAASKIYELTDWGKELEPVIHALGNWGVRSPALPRGGPMSVDCHMLALKTVFDSAAADGLEASYELRVDGHRFRARVSGGGFEIRRGTVEDPDATITADAATFGSLLWEGGKLAEALRAGRIEIEGSKEAVVRFFGVFPLPEPVNLLVEA